MNIKFKEDNSIESRKKEIDIKVKRIQKFLEEKNLNALYLSRQSSFAWITAGGNGVVTICVEDSVASVLITAKGERYLITNIIEKVRMIEEEHMEELGFEVISQEWYENKNAEIIIGIAGDLSGVGSDMVFENCPLVNREILPLQYPLTYNEICRYQYLGDNMSEALEAYLATVKPGMTEFEITGGIANALWPYEIGQVLHLTMVDDRAYKYRHGVPHGDKLNKLLMVSCNGRYKGLITTTTRMVYFGEPSQDFIKQYRETFEIEARMIAATKPGTDDLTAHRIGFEAYKELGYENMFYKHAQGGPQGYYNRYYNVSEKTHGIVQENQCYCYQPVIDGTKCEDAFIATPDGPLMVTKPVSFPKLKFKVDETEITGPGLLIIS